MVKNRKYYWLTWSTGVDKSTPVAYAPEGTPLAHELANQLLDLEELPFCLKIESVDIIESGIKRLGDLSPNCLPVDYQPNSLAWPLMSLKMKKVIDSFISGIDGFRWINVNIEGDKRFFPYFIPFFSKKLDILSIERTLFVPGTDLVINPVFDYKKIFQYQIFHGASQFWHITELIVSQDVRRKLLENSVTGIFFEQASVSY